MFGDSATSSYGELNPPARGTWTFLSVRPTELYSAATIQTAGNMPAVRRPQAYVPRPAGSRPLHTGRSARPSAIRRLAQTPRQQSGCALWATSFAAMVYVNHVCQPCIAGLCSRGHHFACVDGRAHRPLRPWARILSASSPSGRIPSLAERTESSRGERAAFDILSIALTLRARALLVSRQDAAHNTLGSVRSPSLRSRWRDESVLWRIRHQRADVGFELCTLSDFQRSNSLPDN
jgi:hypothetical protein